LPLLQEGKPNPTGWLRRRIVLAVILAVVLILPTLNISFLLPNFVSYGLVFVMIGISLNILMGYAGQISLGHQAFVGVGAFTSALLVSKAGLVFWLALPVAAGTGAFAAVVLGFVALRLAGLYLALITLAYGTLAERVIFSLADSGGAGVQAPRPSGFSSELAYVYLCAAFIALFYYLDWRLVRSKAGRAIMTIRENEIVAASFGINVVAYKLLAFVTSGAIAGVAGAFLAHRQEIAAAADFSFTLALTFVLMVAVGGVGSRAGVFMASFFFAVFPLAAPFPGEVTEAIGAILLLLTLTLNPGGIAQQVRPVTAWLAGKPFSMKHHEGGVQTGGAGVRP
jgi:branched-chain amino acid transport system permease protein